jgi:hypothetical protein
MMNAIVEMMAGGANEMAGAGVNGINRVASG